LNVEIAKTIYMEATPLELASLRGWLFNWTDPRISDCIIYKLLAGDDSRIQGLIAVKDEPANKAIYVKITENAPHNKGRNREYLGVGGNLYAIAALISINKGYGGFVYMDAKNMRLVNHYIEILGASFVGGVHPFRVSINEIAARRLIKLYDLTEG